MATVYVGYRPVLKGRTASEFAFQEKTNTLSGKTRTAVGVYSHYAFFGSGVLDGAPDNNHVPGTGYHPSGLALSRRFLGLDTKNALDGAGDGARVDGARYRPLEYRGLAGAAALRTVSLGHAPRTTDYSMYDNFTFDGVGTEALASAGHARRSIGAVGAPDSFGSFDPYLYKGVGSAALAGASSTYPTGYDSEYGRNRVNEWRGVPSSRAL